MDKLFDPLPKEAKKNGDRAGEMLHQKADDEGYERYKHLCYRNLILEAALSFILGLLFGFVFKC